MTDPASDSEFVEPDISILYITRRAGDKPGKYELEVDPGGFSYDEVISLLTQALILYAFTPAPED